MKVFTIGYQGRRIEELAAVLLEHKISVVLDVREIAWSRKPGFSKTQLQRLLAVEGISYHHEPALGSPRELRSEYRESGNWRRFLTGFKKHLATQKPVLERHASDHSGERVCLLCFEGEAELCHRSAVADALTAFTGATPTHL